jgi:hypothetical protein
MLTAYQLSIFIRQFGRPVKVVLPGNWVNGANGQLKGNLYYSLPRHGNSPVVGAIVYHEELQNRQVKW